MTPAYRMGHNVSMETTVHQRIVQARERASMTQSELAKALGAGQPHVCRWEHGTHPRPQRIRQIAEVLGVSLAWLAIGEGNP